MQGRACRFGDKCRYSHDLSSYLAAKPADLGPVCEVYDAHGECPSGVSCRFGRAHTDATGAQIPHPRKAELQAARDKWAELNFLPYDAFRALGRNKFEYLGFPLAMDAVRGIGRAETSATSSTKETATPVPPTPAAAEAGASATPVETPADVDDNPDAAQARARDNWRGYVVRDARIRDCEKRRVDFTGKIYVAPLTTVGNLPFRRIMKEMGADITCGEMAMASNLIRGQATEWALLRRHPCEDIFGVQVAGGNADIMARTAELIERYASVDFVDINSGCPLDAVCAKGAGAGMMGKPKRLRETLVAMNRILSAPVTLKMRTGLENDIAARFAHTVAQKVRVWSLAASGVSRPSDLAELPDGAIRPLTAAITIHGRTRQQRYSRYADWDYIGNVVRAASEPIAWPRSRWEQEAFNASALDAFGTVSSDGWAIGTPYAPNIPIIGNGDVLSWEDHYAHLEQTGTTTTLLARGCLIKPWLPSEIKSRTTIDISASERLDMLKKFVSYGLEHWGSDQNGVNHTRRFLLEWLSFLCRYVPAGLLEVLPQRMNDRPPLYYGRNDLETLMASSAAEDWIRISEMLLGPVPADFKFVPKHKSNSYGEDGRAGISADQIHGGAAAGMKRDRGAAAMADEDEEGSDVEG